MLSQATLMHNIQQCSTKRHVCGFWHSHAQSVPCTCTCVAWAGRSHIKMAKGRLEEFKELSRLSHHSLRAKVHNCHALWHITLTDLEATILHGVGVHCNRIFHRIFLRVTICKLNLCISTNCTENTMELLAHAWTCGYQAFISHFSSTWKRTNGNGEEKHS